MIELKKHVAPEIIIEVELTIPRHSMGLPYMPPTTPTDRQSYGSPMGGVWDLFGV